MPWIGRAQRCSGGPCWSCCLLPSSPAGVASRLQVAVAVLQLLSAALAGSPGNQAGFIDARGLPLLHDLVAGPNTSAEVLLAALHAYEQLATDCPLAQQTLLVTDVMPRLVGLAGSDPASPLAQRGCWVTLLCWEQTVYLAGIVPASPLAQHWC